MEQFKGYVTERIHSTKQKYSICEVLVTVGCALCEHKDAALRWNTPSCERSSVAFFLTLPPDAAAELELAQ